MDLLEPRGTLVLKSTYHELLHVHLSAIVIQEWTVLGSRCGPFAPALELLRRKAIEVRSLITDRFPLSLGIEALARASQSNAGKVLIQM